MGAEEMRLLSLFLGVWIAGLSYTQVANATTYTNLDQWDDLAFLGGLAPGAPDIGESFTAQEHVLTDFGFLLDTQGASGNANFVIQEWYQQNAASLPQYPVGSPIYTKQISLDSTSGYRWNDIHRINALLTVGKRYVAFLSVENVADPIGLSLFASSPDIGPTNLDFDEHLIYSLFVGNAPPVLTWFSTGGENVYRATFASAVTPVPPALPLFASALSVVGFIGWRRRMMPPD
jgi:hypothetical protein